MDSEALLQLLAASTDRLAALHSELGHPPHHLQDAVAALHTTLHAAIEGQLNRVQKDVDGARLALTQATNKVRWLKVALAETGSQPTTSPDVDTNDEPLLPRVASATSEMNRLQGHYNGRKQQADKLTAELASFEPILGNYVATVRPATPSSHLRPNDDDDCFPEWTPLPNSYLSQLSSAIDKCGHELTRRSEELQAHLYEILGLWSELCLPPETQQEGEESGTPTFDTLVLRHLRLQTVFEEIQIEEGGPKTLEFQGTFLPIDGSDGAADPQSPGSPTRTGGSASSTLQAMRTAETHFPPHVLQPTPENICRAQAKRDWLENEKSRREARIQDLYDALFQLWVKFEVPEEDMDKFVIGNSGSTMAVIEAYEGELVKMEELKQQHMTLFVNKVRERIEELWTELRLSDEQKNMTFPDFFTHVEDADATQLDELLARHEARIATLEAEVEKKGPLLKLVSRYFDLCEEERQLEESAKDTTRLMKGVRGDPGRLLREEKMRKRVKIQKPKMEAELLKAIPAWEAEAGQTFTIDGEKYYEKILALSGGEGAKKRTRVASVATPAADNHSVLQHSSAHVNRSIATPFRTPSNQPTASARRGAAPPASVGAGQTKKPRLAPYGAATQPRAGTAATPTAANVGNLRARVAPPASDQGSRMASSSRIPMPQSPPKAHKSQFAGSSAAIARVSTSGYQAGHTFRPRPSQISRMWPDANPSSGLPRNMSGASIASDATTLCYPGAGSGTSSAYAQAIPSRGVSSHDAAPPQGRPSVNQGKARRGPSMSLEGTLASLAAAGYPRPRTSDRGGANSIRTVSSRATSKQDADVAASSAGGGNWAVLEEEELDDNRAGPGYGGNDGAQHYHHDEMEVF